MRTPNKSEKDGAILAEDKQHLKRAEHYTPDTTSEEAGTFWQKLWQHSDKEEKPPTRHQLGEVRTVVSEKSVESKPISHAEEREQHIKRAENIVPYIPGKRWERWLFQFWKWTGFKERKLTDYLLPLAIALTPLLFNQCAKDREEILATQKDRQAALEKYIENMPVLLKNVKENRIVMQARTQSTLKLLEGDLPRQAVIIDFLRNSGLLDDPQVAVEPPKESVFKNLNLRGINLTGLELYRTNFTKTNLSNGNLTQAQMQQANLEGATLSGAALNQTQLDRANLRGAFLIGAKLENAKITKANLIGADLTEAQEFNKADLTNSFYFYNEDKESDPNNTKFSIRDRNKFDSEGKLIRLGKNVHIPDLKNLKIETLFEKANLSGLQLPGIIFNNTNLKNTNFHKSDLTSASFVSANLTEANLSEATLKATEFIDTNLTDANFRGADLEGADFQGAILTRTNFKLAKNADWDKLKKAKTICNTIMPNGKKQDRDCPSNQKTRIMK